MAELRANMVRVKADFSATPFKAKSSNAEQLRVHTMLVIGGREMEAGAVRVRLHHGGPQGAKPKGMVIADILAGIKDAEGLKKFPKSQKRVASFTRGREPDTISPCHSPVSRCMHQQGCEVDVPE